MPELAVGDTVYVMDRNRRIYEDRTVVYRKHFVPVKIEEETRDSFVIRYNGRAIRIAKKEAAITSMVRPRILDVGVQGIYLSAQAMEDEIFVHEHRAKAAEAVLRASVDTLRKVVALLQDDGAVQQA